MEVERMIAGWEYSQCKIKLASANKNDEVKICGWRAAGEMFHSLLQDKQNAGQARGRTHGFGTLANWRESFEPVVVFTGDRRETPPKSPADLLAVSGSMGDLFNLPRLSLPPETEIRSDKTCVIANPDALRALLQEKNLLIIGSPAANLMARAVNGGACFSFYADKDKLTEEADFQKELQPIRYLPAELERYTDMRRSTDASRSAPEQTPGQKEWARRRRYLIYAFARTGILDPVDYAGPRATATNAHTDYGVVSLCRHPWSENRVAIMAAGLHGPATAAAVKLLSQEDNFSRRPLGGVFRVNVPIDAPWEERYRHLSVDWDTHEYSLEDYESGLNDFCQNHKDELDGQLKFWSPADVRTLVNLLNSPQL